MAGTISKTYARSNPKAKELQNVKEQFHQSICVLGEKELRSSPLIDLIANFDVHPKDKYSRVDFTRMFRDYYQVSNDFLSLS